MTADATLTCLEVRDLLPEFAVGVLEDEERARVERHLAWCAGCRKESSDLGTAAATVGFALAPAPMPVGLRDRVVGRVKRAAGAPGTPRRLRAVAASIVAAFIAVSGLGWGAVMAGRAERFETRAAAAEQRRADALDQMQTILNQLVPGEVPTNETHLAPLSPTAEGTGGGAWILQLVSPRLIDFALVMVNGLDPTATDRLPYRVQLLDAAGQILRVGKITSLDDEGGADVYRQFDAVDLVGFTTVRVVDARGTVVLRGVVDQQA
jgi:Putative zinc-finger